jgi:hypothetical protein
MKHPLSEISKKTRFKLNPTTHELMSGEIDYAILCRNDGYMAWSKTREGPIRPDFAAAVADVKDMKVQDEHQSTLRS